MEYLLGFISLLFAAQQLHSTKLISAYKAYTVNTLTHIMPMYMWLYINRLQGRRLSVWSWNFALSIMRLCDKEPKNGPQQSIISLHCLDFRSELCNGLAWKTNIDCPGEVLPGQMDPVVRRYDKTTKTNNWEKESSPHQEAELRARSFVRSRRFQKAVVACFCYILYQFRFWQLHLFFGYIDFSHNTCTS